MREFFRVIERVERGREFEPTVGEIREEDIWERKGEKESEENADGEETRVVFCSHLISSSGWSRDERTSAFLCGEKSLQSFASMER